MHWLDNITETLINRYPEGEIIVSSGVSPSGAYHVGTLREILTAEVIARAIQHNGRQVRHIHVVDDLDVLRKVPNNVPKSFEKFLGQPLCDIPAPDGSDQSYADYFLSDLYKTANEMHLIMEVVRSNKKYREGFYVPAIEKTLLHLDKVRQILVDFSGRNL